MNKLTYDKPVKCGKKHFHSETADWVQWSMAIFKEKHCSLMKTVYGKANRQTDRLIPDALENLDNKAADKR